MKKLFHLKTVTLIFNFITIRNFYLFIFFLATSILRESEPGSFLVRDSQTYEGAFGLAVKVDTPPASVLKQVNGDVCK